MALASGDHTNGWSVDGIWDLSTEFSPSQQAGRKPQCTSVEMTVCVDKQPISRYRTAGLSTTRLRRSGRDDVPVGLRLDLLDAVHITYTGHLAQVLREAVEVADVDGFDDEVDVGDAVDGRFGIE